MSAKAETTKFWYPHLSSVIDLIEAANEILAALEVGDLSPDEAVAAWRAVRDPETDR